MGLSPTLPLDKGRAYEGRGDQFHIPDEALSGPVSFRCRCAPLPFFSEVVLDLAPSFAGEIIFAWGLGPDEKAGNLITCCS
jgi:hypothetical protein